MDNGVYPGETVPTAVLWLIYFAFPLVFIIAREGLRRYGKYRAVGTLPDALLGLTFSLGLCVVVTVAIKKAVGRPRPNWAALRALVTYGGSAYSDLAGKSMRSFPSGHASESMAGTAYVTLLCWLDLTRRSHDNRRTLVVSLT
ncbi:unnamed protein product, partial [Sphacelaria rigidula]